jgi:hypothetical protein
MTENNLDILAIKKDTHFDTLACRNQDLITLLCSVLRRQYSIHLPSSQQTVQIYL